MKAKKRKPLIDKHGEVRELTREDFREALTFDQLPESLQKTLRGIMEIGKNRKIQQES